VKRRAIRPAVYAVFFAFFAALVFLSHLPFLSLPYYWDEAGQFVPAALDILRSGSWIPHSVVPNIHPPLVMGYLAAVWKVGGFHPEMTRAAMLVVASFALLAAFLLAIELLRHTGGSPAFLAAGFLCASPLFFAQAVLAELDLPAMLFTTLALLLFIQDRLRLSAAVCVLLVMVKETSLVVPLVFLGWLAYERRWKQAALFLAPAIVLGAWVAGLTAKTGHWAGNAGFVHENVIYPSHPLQLLGNLGRRLYYLFVANLHWLGSIAIVLAARRSILFQSRSWKMAWVMVAAHVAMLTPLGGAALERYLLPVLPILYAAMAAGMSRYRPRVQFANAVALTVGMAVCSFVNPPYPFPYENNLAFVDFVKLHREAAGYLESWLPNAHIESTWPLTAEFANPDLGYVHKGFVTRNLNDESLRDTDWRNVDVLILYSRTWVPPYNVSPVHHVSREELRKRVPFPVTAHFEQRGQWVDIFVNPLDRYSNNRMVFNSPSSESTRGWALASRIQAPR